MSINSSDEALEESTAAGRASPTPAPGHRRAGQGRNGRGRAGQGRSGRAESGAETEADGAGVAEKQSIQTNDDALSV